MRRSDDALIDVVTGPSGLIASIDVWNDEPMTYAPTALLGMGEVMASAHESDFVRSTSESVQESEYVRLFNVDAINGVLYLTFQRAHWVRHDSQVRWSFTSISGAPLGTIYTENQWEYMNAIYDVVTYAVDLENGATTSKRALNYSFNASVTDWYPVDNTWDWTGTSVINPWPLAVAESLPSAHPFHSCGQDAWSAQQDEQRTIQHGARGNPRNSFRFYSSIDVQGSFVGRVAGSLNTDAQQRVVQRYSNESPVVFSGYQHSAAVSDCTFFRNSGLIWADSYSEFSAEALVDRQDLFLELDGLSESDRQLFLTATEDPELLNPQPPASAPTDFQTLQPQYLLQADVMKGAYGGLSFDSGQPRVLVYWLQD